MTTEYNVNKDYLGFKYALSIMSGKWKMLIIFTLGYEEKLRYSDLKRKLESVTHKMLSQQLKELETEEMIIRQEFSQVPPKVEYMLSAKGYSLLPIAREMCAWGNKNM